MTIWASVVRALERHGACAVVAVVATRGSAPREAGARMVVLPDGGFTGTIGGGTLEWQAFAEAQADLAQGRRSYRRRAYALGPELGQCCGGRVTVGIEVMDRTALMQARELAELEAAGRITTVGRVVGGRVERQVVGADAAPAPGDDVLVEQFGCERRALYLFGAGHVGRALVLALAPLPFAVAWIDNRPGAFPAAVPGNVALKAPEDVVATLTGAPDGAFVLAMTHSHALDQAIMDAALRAGRFPYVGVIGSATKRARFDSRLAEAGVARAAIERMVCPIGAGGPKSKQPYVIAAAVAVELLVADERAAAGLRPPQAAKPHASAESAGPAAANANSISRQTKSSRGGR